MGIIYCPECREQMDESVARCPNCELEMTPGKITLAKSLHSQRKGLAALGIGAGAVLIVVLFFGLFFGFGNTTPEGAGNEAKKKEDINEFWPEVQTAAKAKFPQTGEPASEAIFTDGQSTENGQSINEESEGFYKITSYVDTKSTNRRYYFDCTATKEGEGSWSIDGVKFGERQELDEK